MTIDTAKSLRPIAAPTVQADTPKWRRRFSRLPLTLYVCLGWLLAMAFIAIFADHLSSHSFRAIDLRTPLAPPAFFPGGSNSHLLGTDELGRDLLARLFLSIRISLLIAFVSTIIAAVIGVTMGFIAAWFRGWVEQAIVVLIDVQAAIPFIVIAIGALAFFGNSLTLFAILLGFHGWERIARISRGLALAAWQQGYATAVRDLGASPWRIYLRHILPNIASTLIVAMTLNFPEVILLESGLSFLGLGVQPPLTSLGAMVGFGRDYMQSAPWVLLAPSLVIVLTTLSVSMVGDWLRDRLDPTLR